MLFRCRSRPGRKSPEPSPRLVVSTHALPSSSSTAEVRRSRAGRDLGSERSDERERPLRSSSPRAPAGSERGREVGEPRSGPEVEATELDGDRLAPDRLVRSRSSLRDEAASVLHQLEQRAADCALVRAARPFFGDCLERCDEPRLPEEVALLEERASRRIDLARPRSSSSRSRASRRHDAWAAGMGTARSQAGARARRAAPRAAGRARSRGRRARPGRRGRRTSRSRRRSGRALSPKGTSSSRSATSRALAPARASR